MRADALMLAGRAVCKCGAIAWPADAAWLDEDHLLARYVPNCDHVTESVRLVHPNELKPEGRCIGVTLEGTRCRRRSTTGHWCSQHAPAWELR
jgi:hypothetical protein